MRDRDLSTGSKLTQIFKKLPPHLRALGQQRPCGESVSQICEEYDAVLAALGDLSKSPDGPPGERYETLVRLREALVEELTELLEQQRVDRAPMVASDRGHDRS